jgi:Na+-driven multidrug efflux pump
MENEVTTLDGGETSESAEQKQNKGKIDFNKPLWKSIFLFFLPLMLSNTLNSISGTISSIILGRIIGVTALAAVSAFFPILFLLISFVIGVGAGSSVLIGQAFGAQEWKKVKVIVGTTLTSTFLIGLIVAIPGYFFTYELLELTGTPADVIDMSAGFARITFIAMPVVFFLFYAYTTFFRGSGDSNTPFYFLAVSTALNILLTPALVIGWGFLPAMGVNGAALANPYSCTGFINRFSSLPEKSESPTAV